MFFSVFKMRVTYLCDEATRSSLRHGTSEHVIAPLGLAGIVRRAPPAVGKGGHLDSLCIALALLLAARRFRQRVAFCVDIQSVKSTTTVVVKALRFGNQYRFIWRAC